jgi:hypothetical protein
MADAPNRFPEALADDPSEIVQALEIARALWDKGERRDATRWVRRAAEVADEAGKPQRVAALARAAADLDSAKAYAPTSQTRPASRAVPPPISSPAIPPPLPSKRAVAPPTKPGVPVPEPSSPREMRARVSVRMSARDPNLFVVRQLAEGEAAPPGTHEAFLIISEPAAKGKGNVA